MRSPRRMKQDSWAGGVNLNNPLRKAEDQCNALVNARIQLEGTIARRGGNFRMNATAIGSSILNIHFPSYGTERYYAHAGNRIWYSSVTNEELPGITWTTLSPASSHTGQTIVFKDFVYGVTNVATYVAGGGAALGRFTDTTYTAVGGSPPSGLLTLEVYNRRLFGTDGASLFWSGLDDGDSLGNAGAGGGQAIIRTTNSLGLIFGLMTVADSLMIIHENGVSRFTGWSQDDISVQSGTVGMDNDFGTIAPNSCLASEGEGYFFHPTRGLIKTDGVSAVSVSNFVDAQFTSNWNYNTIQVRNISQHEIAVVNSAISSFLVYNTTLGAWSGGWTFGGGTITPTSIHTTPAGFAFGATDGYLRWNDTRHPLSAVRTLDDMSTTYTGGSAITMVAETRPLDGGDPFMEKSLRFLHGQCTVVGPTTAFSIREGTTELDGDTIPSQTAAFAEGMFRVPVAKRVYSPYVEIQDAGTGVPPLFGAVELFGYDMEMRGGYGTTQ